MRGRKHQRLKGFDYTRNRLYFISINIELKSELLSEVVYNDNFEDFDDPIKQVVLNPAGEIVKKNWLLLKERYPYVFLHEFIIMPDHFHGILEINSQMMLLRNKDSDNLSETIYTNILKDEIKIKSLSQLIGAFKTVSSKELHQCGYINFQWSRSFHDHIIRNHWDYCRIKEYILSNPNKWSNLKLDGK